MSKSPIRPTDDEARALARRLIEEARFGSLAVMHPDTQSPHVTRIGMAAAINCAPITLISDLALHARALKENGRCSLLLGEPPGKGDPLAFARLTLDATANFVARDAAEFAALQSAYLLANPKAALYANFADFNIVQFTPISGSLNAGFGKAYHLKPNDLSWEVRAT
jgi:putative heme iron utilization protein